MAKNNKSKKNKEKYLPKALRNLSARAKKITKKKVKRTKKEKKEKKKEKKQFENTLDLALLCDCTSSMSAWIERAKNTLKQIIDNIQKEFSKLKVRVAFVGYRDFCDGDLLYSIKNFTEDIAEIKTFISAQNAIGGGDAPEDVAGGLFNCLQLDWQSK